MSDKPVEVTTPVGRLVGGHPMVHETVKDDKTGQPKMQADGVTPRTSAFFALAIPKGQESGWWETPWGQKIYQAGVAGFPGGAHQRADFAWKVEDGDSTIPNKRNKRNCDREGFPGHWILRCSTGLTIRCYHDGKFSPHEQIQQKEAIKPGDYGRAALLVKANGSDQSPGVYLNPDMFALTRAGIEIQLGEQRDAADAFSQPAEMPANAQVDPNAGATPPPAASGPAPGPAASGPAPGPSAAPAGVQPAPDFANGPAGPAAAPAGPSAPAAAEAEPMYYDQNGGGPFTKAQLQAVGYTDAHFATLQKA